MSIDFTKYNQLLDVMNLNRNPIPIDISNRLTTSRWLQSITELIKQIMEDVEENLQNNNDYTDQEIAKITEIVNSNYLALSNLVAVTKDELLSYTDAEINNVISMVNMLGTNIGNEITALKSKDDRLTDSVAELYNMLDKGVVYVINPVTGFTTQVQVAINDLYDLINSNQLGENFTATLYDTLNMTASDYDILTVTARQYDRDWFEIFFE